MGKNFVKLPELDNASSRVPEGPKIPQSSSFCSRIASRGGVTPGYSVDCRTSRETVAAVIVERGFFPITACGN